MWCFCGKVKKPLDSESKNKNDEAKCWFRKKKRSDQNSIQPEPDSTPSLQTPPALIPDPTASPPPPPPPIPIRKPTRPPPPPPAIATPEPTGLSEAETEQTKHAYSLAIASARAAEAAVVAAQAAAEVVRLTTTNHFAGKSKQEVAAIKIQTAFRGYLARRSLRVLRGLKRLQTMMQGQAIKRQTTNTLKTMQTLAKMQSDIRERRLKMAEENLARQKLIQQKHAKEQAKLELQLQKTGDDWDSRILTKEEIEANQQYRHEAAIRREKTLAYSYTHQQTWKSTARSANTLFMEQNNPHWGWSWMERWLAARPWETMTMPETETGNENSPRTKGLRFTLPNKNEMTKSYARSHNTEKPAPTTSIPKQARSSTSRLSTSSAPSKSVSSPVAGAVRKLRSRTPKASPKASMWGPDNNDDAKSTVSMRSGVNSKRNSCSSAKDDNESVASSQMVPSYMAPTQSAKARSRSVTPDRKSVSSVKKSSCTPSPAKSRRSTSSEVNSISEHA